MARTNELMAADVEEIVREHGPLSLEELSMRLDENDGGVQITEIKQTLRHLADQNRVTHTPGLKIISTNRGFGGEPNND